MGGLRSLANPARPLCLGGTPERALRNGIRNAPHQCGQELPAPVQGGAGGGGLRFDDGAGHGRLGDLVEACACRPVPLAVRQLRDFNPGPVAPAG